VGARDRLFTDIDSMDPDAFARYLAPTVTMRFGNAEPLVGRTACRDAWAGFCDLVDGVHHDVRNLWEVDDTTIAETDVTYTRRDGRKVTVPVVTVYRVDADDMIDSYRVFLDLGPVFADAP
jgi:hypothetical protein